MTGTVDEVVLVDDHGSPIGRQDRHAVHTTATPRHLAFSCWIVDADGALLMTRRALGKRAWPGVWTNACCGHPRPGESIESALVRRVEEELGFQPDAVSCLLPDFGYRATDPNGIVEYEFCPVYRAELTDRDGLRPDPAEVMDWAWAPADAVADAMRGAPYAFSPWAAAQIGQLGPAAFGSQQQSWADRC